MVCAPRGTRAGHGARALRVPGPLRPGAAGSERRLGSGRRQPGARGQAGLPLWARPGLAAAGAGPQGCSSRPGPGQGAWPRAPPPSEAASRVQCSFQSACSSALSRGKGSAVFCGALHLKGETRGLCGRF